jgi:hypothetical protein
MDHLFYGSEANTETSFDRTNECVRIKSVAKSVGKEETEGGTAVKRQLELDF